MAISKISENAQLMSRNNLEVTKTSFTSKRFINEDLPSSLVVNN